MRTSLRKKQKKRNSGQYVFNDGIDKKLNKRILKEKVDSKRTRIIIIVTLLIFLSPLWFYRGIMYEIMLPSYGEQTKAVLTGTMGQAWGGRRIIPCYYYTFDKNGKLYSKNADISVKDTLYQIGDTVDILYLEALPFISSRIKNDK